ncbi:checkpoint clamp complex protein [Planoprotostelium fungivorum]|uniref:Checkpoint protein n=1 Tax=Planoprotostelium fungivorum TaxID=1890364 RepID=A0A2P6NXN4_9EUKA|nr:checkpoint clamp complex protein [Planoprotostelium fungivorum]
MRFKARVLPDKATLFQRVVSTVLQISKECVIHLTQTKMQFILAAEITEGGMQVWSGIASNCLFEDYAIESLNNNEIAFEISLDHLQRALKSGQDASEMLFKLVKKNGVPYLSFVIEKQGQQTMSIVQDVPISMLTQVQFSSYIEPHLPDPDVQIMMPPLKILRNVIDKMKNVGEYLSIWANMAGEIRFKVESDMVTIQTSYRNLDHPQIEGKSPPRVNPELEAEGKVRVKQFSKFLYSYQVLPNNVVCCIVEGKAVVIHILLDDLYMTYYIPMVVL